MQEISWNATDGQRSSTYCLSSDDTRIIASLAAMLDRLHKSDLPTASQLITLEKALRVLRRLPQASEEFHSFSIMVQGPRRKFGTHVIHHAWEFNVEGDNISIQSGGHFFRPETGGDSFTSFMWDASPGNDPERRDYLSQLGVLDDAAPFDVEVDRIHFAPRAYALAITDKDAPDLAR